MRQFLAILLVICVVIPASAASPSDWNQATRSATLTAIENALSHYYFIDRVPKMRATIEANRVRLDQIQQPDAFADAVTKVLYGVAHDKHIEVDYSSDVLPDFRKMSAADIANVQRGERYYNYGLDAAIRLHGNIGYLWVDNFPESPQSAYDAAMSALAHTDALIIDLRDNGGGAPGGVNYLLAFFFAKQTEVTGFLERKNGVVVLQRHYTAAKVGAARYLDKPVFVLISKDTFSGAEQFAYDVKSLHRAELVGHITGGGANPGEEYRLNDHFGMFIPFGSAYNPYTKTNWEGVGVPPQVDAPAKNALLVAYVRALKAVKNTFPDSVEVREEALKDPARALRESLPQR